MMSVLLENLMLSLYLGGACGSILATEFGKTTKRSRNYKKRVISKKSVISREKLFQRQKRALCRTHKHANAISAA